MTPHAELLTYFTAERDLGWAALGVGIAAAITASLLWRGRAVPVRKGLLVPVLLLALGGIVGGPILAGRSSGQIEGLGARIQSDPAAVRGEELPRMQQVNANWTPLKIGWLVVIAAGGAVAAFRRGTWRGAAIGTVGLAATLLVVDTFAERRADRYTEMLRQLP